MSGNSNINYSTRTAGGIKIVTAAWTIPNLKHLLENKSKFKTKTGFPVSKDDSSLPKFLGLLRFIGRDNVKINVYFMSSDFEVHLTKLILKICSKTFIQERLIVNKEYCPPGSPVEANQWQYLASFFKSDITNDLNNEGGLTLKFQFNFTSFTLARKVDRIHVPKAKLSIDFENLLHNGLFSDVIMKSVENIEFKVHKAILATRSEVLKAHFEHNTTESITIIVESPLESDVLREVLTFIYSDKAPRVDEIPEKLLAAADYYHLSRLKSLCEEALHKKLTVENVIDTLQLADLHSSTTLKQFTLDFIKDGRAQCVIKTEGWAKFKSVDLIKNIFEYINTANC